MSWYTVGVASMLAATASGVSKAQEDDQDPPAAPDVTRDEPASAGEEGPQSKTTPGISARIVETYSSNLYHEQKRHEDDFNRNDPGERYFEMEGPGDFITEASVEGSLKWKLGDDRTAKASLGAGYFFHLQNAIANYFELEGTSHYDVSRHDRLMLDAGFVPHRFKKNYSIREVAGAKFYEHAYYWQVEPSLGYRHKWSSRWWTDFTYELGIRRYLDPFGNRDTTRNDLTALVVHDFGRVDAGLGAGGAIGTTPSGLEFGVPVDRSYWDAKVLGTLSVELPHGFGVGADIEYRIRHYTTDEPANDTYFDRTDRRWELNVDAKKQLGDVFAILATAGWTRNDTNRQDHPNVDPTDLAYQEFVVGVGIGASL